MVREHNIGLRLSSECLYQHAEYGAIRKAYKQFKIEVLHTNDVSGVGLFKAKTEQPISDRMES